jgi:uncharacterized protein (DUF952 family)
VSDAVTYHLVAADYWRGQHDGAEYVPEAFAADGFIHCTDGAQNLIDTANRYYRDDPREFVALVIDQAKVLAEIRYEDVARIYPHIYGPLNRDAVVGVVQIVRAADGAFTSMGG